MGKWDKKRQRVKDYSEKVLKNQKEVQQAYSDLVAAAAQVARLARQTLPRLENYQATMSHRNETLGQTAAELSAYEIDHKNAKQDKTKQKEIERKMKPLERHFEKEVAELKETVASWNSDTAAMDVQVKALSKAISVLK